MKRLFRKGVRVYATTKINEKIENQTQLFTETGHTVHAQTVILAIGYEAQEEVKDKNAVILSSYAIATNQIADQAKWHDNMMIWETARPYLYARKTPDNRIIIGGLDESTGYLEKRDSMILNKRDKLIKQLFNLFPELENRIWADYYWGLFLVRAKMVYRQYECILTILIATSYWVMTGMGRFTVSSFPKSSGI
ncbi:FAD-dependent oxidoreductase [Peribacillus frigoritolerans]|uniref:FAD-dependent oxidoreductase n=1 Tax=Peribacillus frigoritolerans TaxID=450367 RepID=UPI003B8CB872